MLRVATFKLDCTPPEGYPIGFGANASPATIRDPLFMRGFVLEDSECRCVVVSLDYTGLMNSAQDDMVAALARAVDVPPDHVIVHCVHQHDAPLLDFELPDHPGGTTFPREWWEQLCGTCGAAAGACLAGMRPVAAVGHREVRVRGYASNRRIIGEDGKVRGMRFSRCSDHDLVSQPVGIIDPLLRTVAFRDHGGNTLGSMSFYATHPQVANGRGMFSADAPGEALRLVEAETEGGMHAYFSGAFGNVTAGKYSSATDLEGNLLTFGRRLADAMILNLQGMVWEAPSGIGWTTLRFPFPRIDMDRAEPPAQAKPERGGTVEAAVRSCYDYDGNRDFTVTQAQMGRARILFVPGEPFVEYQLFLQSLTPDGFVAMAGNCGDSFLYLPLAEHFPQGGYEVSSFRWCTEAFEERLKETMATLVLEPSPGTG